MREHGVLTRFADDALVMCKSRAQAEAALARLRELLAELGLEPKEAKTRIVHLQVGAEGLTFLGFTTTWCARLPVPGNDRSPFLPAGPRTRLCNTLGTGCGS